MASSSTFSIAALGYSVDRYAEPPATPQRTRDEALTLAALALNYGSAGPFGRSVNAFAVVTGS